MTNTFYYDIEKLLDRVKTYSLYHEDGREKEFDDISIGLDDYPFLRLLLETACNEVYNEVISMVPDVIESDVYGFGEDVVLEEETLSGDYVFYVLTFPLNINSKNFKNIDGTLKETICHKTFYKWLEKKGRFSEKVYVEKEKFETKLKEVINYRTTLSRTYSMY